MTATLFSAAVIALLVLFVILKLAKFFAFLLFELAYLFLGVEAALLLFVFLAVAAVR